MELGMLWIDAGHGGDIVSRVQEAAASYEAQYGVVPNLCLLNPSQLNENEGEMKGMRFEASPSLLPNYFWIGRTVQTTVLLENAEHSLG